MNCLDKHSSWKDLYKQHSHYVGEYDYLSHIGCEGEVAHKIKQSQQQMVDIERQMSPVCMTLHRVLLKLRL